MKKLRIGIIGNGGIAKWAHIPAYKNMDNVEIIAVCDILEERAKEASEMLGGKPAVFTDYKELLKAEGLDAVDICTPKSIRGPPPDWALVVNQPPLPGIPRRRCQPQRPA